MARCECLGEITVFEKSGGVLTKRLRLRDGKIVYDSSAGLMAHGFAHRVVNGPAIDVIDVCTEQAEAVS